MENVEIERKIRQAGYDLQWDQSPSGDTQTVCALRDGKRHTRSFATLLLLAEYLGRVDRPVQFVDDGDALDKVIAKHNEDPRHFTVRRGLCRVALFNRQKYVELVSATGSTPAMYEIRTDSLRRASKHNLPAEVVSAFAGASSVQDSAA